MDMPDKDKRTSKTLRYSISTLLQIEDFGKKTQVPFDLSRLSFATFQAGLVRPSACYTRTVAMPLQDISFNRNRGWSFESTTSVDECLPVSSIGKQQPQRPPVNPPEPSRQADEGFARFLKKHASPTHQRVTAGGRIVPMEPAQAPPQFEPHIKGLAHGAVHTVLHKGVRISCANETKIRDDFQNGGRRPLNPHADFRFPEDRHIRTEPFPKFYDGQNGQDNGYGFHDDGNERNMDDGNTEDRLIALNLGQRTLNTSHSNAPHPLRHSLSAEHNSEPPALESQLPLGLSMLGSNPVMPAYNHLQLRVQGQQSLHHTSSFQQYLPHMMPSATEDSTTTFATYSGDNGRVTNQQVLTPSYAAYPVYEASDETAQRPRLFPITAAGLQTAPYLGLPIYGRQSDLHPAGYCPAGSFNGAASIISPLSVPQLAAELSPLAVSLALSTGISSTLAKWQYDLANAETVFQEYTQKENALDQYLAMNREKLDHQTRAYHAAQRMQIVEDRSQAKTTINRLQKDLNILNGIASSVAPQPYQPALVSTETVGQARSANKLNVQAHPWVPKTGADNNKAIKICMPPGAATRAPERATLVADAAALVTADTIATLSLDVFVAHPVGDANSPQQPPVDEWGARIGAAPPELQRQQSDMLESMVSERSINSDLSVSPPAGSSGKASSGDIIHPFGAWDSDNLGRAPPSIEADYELYLDAMREDRGKTTIITLSGGRKVEVQGQAYKQPALENLDDFQREYWQRKPDPVTKASTVPRSTQRTFDNLRRAGLQPKSQQTQDWVNDVICSPKSSFTGHAPWIADGTNLLNTKGDSSVALQNVHVTSKTMGGLDGVRELLKGRSRTVF